MWKKLFQFLPSVGLWVVAGGLEVSGIEIPWLGYSLMGLGFVLLIIPLWSPIRKMGKSKLPLKVILHNVSIGSLQFDRGQDITQFLVRLTLEPSNEIQLGKLDLSYSDKPYEPMKMPTALVKRAESYEVEYRVPGASGRRLMEYGFYENRQAPDNERPRAYLHVMAGGLDRNTQSFPIPTPKNWSTSHKRGFQIL